MSFLSQAWADYLYWQETGQRIVERINALLKDIVRHPFTGIGKPEPLWHQFKGFWSRRIDATHSLVYRQTDAISVG